jgi:outer membrane protein assembly factor BamB
MAEHEREEFLSAEIDEQIDDYLAPPTTTNQARDIPAQDAVQALQRHFASSQQNAALQRVWQRFEQSRATKHTLEQARTLRTTTRQERRYRMKPILSHDTGNSNSLTRRLALAAAVIFVFLLVASMAMLFHLTPGKQTMVGGTTRETQMFALTADGILYRLDMKTHQPLWHFNTPPNTARHLGQLLGNSYYYVTTQKLYVLDAANGKVRWQSDIATGTNYTFYIISGNTIYLAFMKDSYPTIQALDTTSGTIQWERRMGEKITHSTHKPDSSIALTAASDEAVYGNLTLMGNKTTAQRFALKAQDGSQLWLKTEDGAYFGATKGFLFDGVLCVAKEVLPMNDKDISGYLVGYDATNGRQLWSKWLENVPTMISPKVLNGVIYVSIDRLGQNKSNLIYAFSVHDGRQIWRYEDTSTSDSPYPTVTENGIYIINRENGQTLVAIDLISGKPRWTYNFQDQSTLEYPPTVDNEQVYLSLPNNVIQILRVSDGKPVDTFTVEGRIDPDNRVLLQVVS